MTEDNVFLKKLLEDFDPANNDYDKEIAARLGTADDVGDAKDILDTINLMKNAGRTG